MQEWMMSTASTPQENEKLHKIKQKKKSNKQRHLMWDSRVCVPHQRNWTNNPSKFDDSTIPLTRLGNQTAVVPFSKTMKIRKKPDFIWADFFLAETQSCFSLLEDPLFMFIYIYMYILRERKRKLRVPLSCIVFLLPVRRLWHDNAGFLFSWNGKKNRIFL